MSAAARWLLKLTDPTGKVFYIPHRYGHGVHALTEDEKDAELFATEQFVNRYINNNIHCLNAFWNSERRHAELTRKQYAGWTFQAVPTERTTHGPAALRDGVHDPLSAAQGFRTDLGSR